MLGSPKAGAMADGAANAPASPPPTPKGVEIINKKRCPRALLRRDPWRLHRPRLNKALGIICRLAEFNPLRPRNSGAQMLNLLACPPLPHPNWARSVAPASLGGRRKRRFFRPVWQGLPPAPIPCALPQWGRAPYRLGVIKYFNFSCREPWAYSPRTPARKIERKHLGCCRGRSRGHGDKKKKLLFIGKDIF